MVKNSSQQQIKIPMAIKGFLSGKSQSGGAIVSIIDIDAAPVVFGSIIEKYLVILMELGLVVLLVKY